MSEKYLELRSSEGKVHEISYTNALKSPYLKCVIKWDKRGDLCTQIPYPSGICQILISYLESRSGEDNAPSELFVSSQFPFPPNGLWKCFVHELSFLAWGADYLGLDGLSRACGRYLAEWLETQPLNTGIEIWKRIHSSRQ